MNAEVKAKWVAALRSGDYEQGHTALCRTDGATGHPTWCCLGVAFDALAEDGGATWEPMWDAFGNTWAAKYGESDDTPRLGTLPVEFREHLGLKAHDQDHLISMNDSRRYSFTQIADWIEENL